MCWTAKAGLAWLSLSLMMPIGLVFWLSETNNKFGGKVIMMDDIWTRKFWKFWGQVMLRPVVSPFYIFPTFRSIEKCY